MITGFPTTLYLLSVFVSVASALHFPSISFRNPHSSASSLSIPSRPVVAQYHLSFKPSTSPSDDNKDDAVDLSYYFYIFANLDGSLEADDTKEKRKMWLHDQKSQGKKAVFTLSGWEDLAFALAKKDRREKLVAGIVNLIRSETWDGVDFDLELVGGRTGKLSATDFTHLNKLLASLRSFLPTNTLITASVPFKGFALSNASVRKTSRLVKRFASHVDFVTIMAFDFHAPAWSSSTGPNSPLAQCSEGSSSVAIAVQNWLILGMPKDQVLLGIGTYSHAFKTKLGRLQETWWNDVKTKAFQELESDELVEDQNLSLDDMIKSGILSPNGMTGAGDYKRFYDSCTATPFLWSPKTRLFFAYEDKISVAVKADWARSVGLRGLNFYDAQGTTKSVLAVARNGLDGSARVAALLSSTRKNSSSLEVDGDEDDTSIFEGGLLAQDEPARHIEQVVFVTGGR